MKKVLFLVLALICMFSLCACNTVSETETEICAFIKEIKDDIIIVDVAEYITSDDTERLEELSLTEADVINGYYINNPEVMPEEYKLTEETVYNFIDWKNDFVEKGADRSFSTENVEDFIKYLGTYENAQPNMPFFLEISGNEVISITEKPMM